PPHAIISPRPDSLARFAMPTASLANLVNATLYGPKCARKSLAQLNAERPLDDNFLLTSTSQKIRADARASLELITAIYQAHESGQAVSLPLDRDTPGYDGWMPEGQA
ncbi:MAG: hypothetical protein HC871_14470, partial [Rhizobiales bacterium]|nr:hypothetical protein [Hyphomicrobiales bacterium]